MRALIGLVALLISAFIVAYIWSEHTRTVSRAGRQAQQQAYQLSGRDETGMTVKDSITLKPIESGGQTRAVLVEKVIVGGPMEKYYGLKTGDRIIRIGDRSVGLFDGEMAALQVIEAHRAGTPLVVIRDDREITLPLRQTPQPGNDPIRRQLDAIPGIR